MNKECLIDYRNRLEQGIEEYMKMPAGQKSAEAIRSMFEALALVESNIKDAGEVTNEELEHWVASMKNTDGTTGQHWSKEQTTAVGVPMYCDEYTWWATMNMVYSDYHDVAERYGVDVVEFYCDMAKAFLQDEDAVDDKLSAYVHHVANLKV